MTQSSVQTWCDRVQAKLMATLDATWAVIDTSDDPAEIRRARDKAKACGEMAATVRKIAAITPRPRPQKPSELPPPASAVDASTAGAPRKLDKLKGGGRGRL